MEDTLFQVLLRIFHTIIFFSLLLLFSSFLFLLFLFLSFFLHENPTQGLSGSQVEVFLSEFWGTPGTFFLPTDEGGRESKETLFLS